MTNQAVTQLAPHASHSADSRNPRRAGNTQDPVQITAVTHLIEAGYDPLFVQQQVGHSYASTTALYTSVSSDYRTRTLRRVLDGTLDTALAPPSSTKGS